MNAHDATEQQWVIWNGSLGMLVLVAIGRVEDGTHGFLEAPFDFVGPFSLDELQRRGRIAFGAALIMSRTQWREEQAELRREAREQRRAQTKRLASRLTRTVKDDARHRRLLDLPLDAALEVSAIKAAFRRSAKRAHPDGGGSSEQFRRITEARDALLGCAEESVR